MFSGVYTALITPFKDGKIDYASLERIVEFQVQSGVAGIVSMGTTGESPTIPHDEHIEIIKKTAEIIKGRIHLMAGTGSNSTSEAIHLSERAQKAGADSVLLVNPYYNKPSQKGMIEHFAAISNSVDVPVVLYNIPGRTVVNFLPESVLELSSRAKNLCGVKEASGDITQMMRLIEICGDKIDVLSGDDSLLLPLLSVGGKGVVSVLSNILPSLVVEVVRLFEDEKHSEARALFYKLLPLARSMFVETNPIPIKAVMAKAGWCSPDVRLPLTELPAEKLADIVKLFEKSGEKI